MTTLAHHAFPPLPRLALPRGTRDAGEGRLFSFVLMVLGAVLVATVLATAFVAFTQPDYTVVAQTLVERDGALLTVYDGRY